MNELNLTITISVRWVVDYLPIILLDMDGFTKNHKRITIMTFLVVCNNLIRTSLLHTFCMKFLCIKFYLIFKISSA